MSITKGIRCNGIQGGVTAKFEEKDKVFEFRRWITLSQNPNLSSREGSPGKNHNLIHGERGKKGGDFQYNENNSYFCQYFY